jgi:polyhydroxybutyrate depolymerase
MTALRGSLVLGVLLAVAFVGCRDRSGDDDVPAPTPSATAETATREATAAAPTSTAPTTAPSVTSTPAPTATPLADARPVEAGTRERQLDYDGRERGYLLHIPPAYDGTTPLPVVLVFHGGGGSGNNAIKQTHFDRVADANGFIAVFPHGSGLLRRILLTWNAGNCCGWAVENEVDDVGFVRALIRELTSTLAVDARRIYATGLSNGAMMSYLLGCEAADLIAAIGPVAGAQNSPDCAPSSQLSLIAIHGDADRSVLYGGGTPEVQADRLDRVDNSVANSTGFFASLNDCDTPPEPSRSGSIHHDVWEGCVSGRAVELYTVLGGGHAWPGGQPGFAGSDTPTTEIDASELIWAFFAAHPKPQRPDGLGSHSRATTGNGAHRGNGRPPLPLAARSGRAI